MRVTIPFLAVTLALTVFLTSLVLETRDSRGHRANTRFGTPDAVPAKSRVLFGQLGPGRQLLPTPPSGEEGETGRKLNTLLGQAWTFYEARNFQGALELVRAAAEIEPENPTVLEALGALHFALQEYPEAETHLAHLLKLKPDMDDVSRMRLAVAQMRQRKYEAAIEHLTAIRENVAEDGAVNFALACVYASLNRPESALDHLELAHSQLGYGLFSHISDPQLDSLRNTERFQALLRAARTPLPPTAVSELPANQPPALR